MRFNFLNLIFKNKKLKVAKNKIEIFTQQYYAQMLREKLKNNKILIIHGRGLGIVRESVHSVLSRRKEVTKYHTDNLNDGCTIVYLSVDN